MVFRGFIILVMCICFNYNYGQNNFKFFVSNYGNDTNSGLSPALAKLNIQSISPFFRGTNTANKRVIISLKQGHVFNETLFPTTTVSVNSFADTGLLKRYAILNGTDNFNSGWVKVNNFYNAYFQPITHNGFTGGGINNIGFYSYVYVVEIDKELEKIAPITARRPLQFTSSIEQMDTIPGSFFEKIERVNPVNVYVHTSDSKAPNNHNKYRYEVVVRDRAFEGYDVDNNVFENIWARGYGGGFGPLPSGSKSIYKNVIFGPGAGIHHVVLKDGKMNNCLFFPGSRHTNGNAVVFYNIQGYNASNSVSRSMFLDIPESIYSHTSGGQNYRRLDISETYFFGNWDTHYAIGLGDTDSIFLQKIYADHANIGYGGTTKYSKIENSYFINIGQIGLLFSNQLGEAEVKNIFIKNTGLASQVYGIFSGDGLNLNLSNSIIHLTNGNGSVNRFAFIGANREKYGKLKIEKNIFICDIDKNGIAFGGTTGNINGLGSTPDILDNNIYILQKGSQIFWNTTKYSENNFKAWQTESGQDKHSLFIDIRNDPRELKAIFIDPENGNYELANTIYGNRIKSMGAGMVTPPVCFAIKPSYEKAADMNQANTLPEINSCRQPCQKTQIEIKADKILNGRLEICQGQQINLEGKGVYTENGKRYVQSDNTSRFLWWNSNEQDTSGIYLNQIKPVFNSVGITLVKLQIVDINGCASDTSLQVNVLPRPLQPHLGRDTSLCNGQTINLKLQHSIANISYKWNDSTSQTFLAVKQPGSYWVKGTNALGCSSADTINITQIYPVKVFLGDDKIYCVSSPLTLSTIITGDVQSIVWSTGSIADTLTINKAGQYSVAVTDTASCIARDTILVVESPLNTFRFPADTAICSGSNFIVNLKTPSNTLVSWADGVNAGNRSVTNGQFKVTLQNKDCIIDHKMNFGSVPLPAFNLRADTSICQGFPVDLKVNIGATRYLWSTGNTSDRIMVKQEGIYWAEAYKDNCVYRDTFNLKVMQCDCNITMPNAFSPNNDGVNDTYRPLFKCYPIDYNFQIFSRYGQPLFKTIDTNVSWDGTSQKNPLPVGTYYYILSYYDLKERRIVKRSGGITLLK